LNFFIIIEMSKLRPETETNPPLDQEINSDVSEEATFPKDSEKISEGEEEKKTRKTFRRRRGRKRNKV